MLFWSTDFRPCQARGVTITTSNATPGWILKCVSLAMISLVRIGLLLFRSRRCCRGVRLRGSHGRVRTANQGRSKRPKDKNAFDLHRPRREEPNDQVHAHRAGVVLTDATPFGHAL